MGPKKDSKTNPSPFPSNTNKGQECSFEIKALIESTSQGRQTQGGQGGHGPPTFFLSKIWKQQNCKILWLCGLQDANNETRKLKIACKAAVRQVCTVHVAPINKIIHVTMQLCRKSVNRTKIQTFKKEMKEH